jgi:hypothetical protein
MEAIVLTCDKYRPLTEHMIFQYGRLWPDHPFRFRIPYQTLIGPKSANREYRPCNPDFKSTILSLLEDLDDEQLIYWCMDDKYPIKLHLTRIRALLPFVFDLPSSVSGILFCRCRDMLKKYALTGDSIRTPQGHRLLRRNNYLQIWLHQFMRAKVLRYLFQSFPDDISFAKQMDPLKNKIPLPPSHALYVTAKNLAVFGESTTRGKLTANCAQSMHRYDLPVPTSFVLDNQHTVMGKQPLLSWHRGWVK